MPVLIQTGAMEVDEDEILDVNSVSISSSTISSFIMPRLKYNIPESLKQEIMVLFFSTSKGLHDKHHNTLKLHKTPLEIQMNVNEEKEHEFDFNITHGITPKTHFFDKDVGWIKRYYCATCVSLLHESAGEKVTRRQN